MKMAVLAAIVLFCVRESKHCFTGFAADAALQQTCREARWLLHISTVEVTHAGSLVCARLSICVAKCVERWSGVPAWAHHSLLPLQQMLQHDVSYVVTLIMREHAIPPTYSR